MQNWDVSVFLCFDAPVCFNAVQSVYYFGDNGPGHINLSKAVQELSW